MCNETGLWALLKRRKLSFNNFFQAVKCKVISKEKREERERGLPRSVLSGFAWGSPATQAEKRQVIEHVQWMGFFRAGELKRQRLKIGAVLVTEGAKVICLIKLSGRENESKLVHLKETETRDWQS